MKKQLTATQAKDLAEKNALPCILRNVESAAKEGLRAQALYGHKPTKKTIKALKALGYEVVKGKYFIKVRW